MLSLQYIQLVRERIYLMTIGTLLLVPFMTIEGSAAAASSTIELCSKIQVLTSTRFFTSTRFSSGESGFSSGIKGEILSTLPEMAGVIDTGTSLAK